MKSVVSLWTVLPRGLFTKVECVQFPDTLIYFSQLNTCIIFCMVTRLTILVWGDAESGSVNTAKARSVTSGDLYTVHLV